MSATLQDILDLLESRYPSSWAVSGDRFGLEVGHPGQPVETILVALEATPAVVAEAAQRSAQLLLTHHPLLHQPLADAREDRPGGHLLATLMQIQDAFLRGRIQSGEWLIHQHQFGFL